MTMEKQKIKLITTVLKQDNAILAVYLFGSQAKGKARKYSDIDIAVLFDKNVREKDYTDKQVDIMTNLSGFLNKEIDVIVLNTASLFLRYHILKSGMKIYERPRRTDHSFEALAIVQYLDFLPIKNRIENGLLAKIKGA